jgi:hypothetical protein
MLAATEMGVEADRALFQHWPTNSTVRCKPVMKNDASPLRFQILKFLFRILILSFECPLKV